MMKAVESVQTEVHRRAEAHSRRPSLFRKFMCQPTLLYRQTVPWHQCSMHRCMPYRPSRCECRCSPCMSVALQHPAQDRLEAVFTAKLDQLDSGDPGMFCRFLNQSQNELSKELCFLSQAWSCLGTAWPPWSGTSRRRARSRSGTERSYYIVLERRQPQNTNTNASEGH